MFGAVEFYRKAREAGSLIIGCEAYMAPGSRLEKIHISRNDYYHLILLATNLRDTRTSSSL